MRRGRQGRRTGIHVEVQDEGEVPSLDFDVHVSIERNASEFPLGLGILAAMRPGRDMKPWHHPDVVAATSTDRGAIKCDRQVTGALSVPHPMGRGLAYWDIPPAQEALATWVK